MLEGDTSPIQFSVEFQENTSSFGIVKLSIDTETLISGSIIRLEGHTAFEVEIDDFIRFEIKA